MVELVRCQTPRPADALAPPPRRLHPGRGAFPDQFALELGKGVEDPLQPDDAAHILEGKVFEMIRESMLDPGKLHSCIDTGGRLDDQSVARGPARVAGEIRTVDEERRRIIGRYAAEQIAGDEYIAADHALDRDLERLTRKKAELVAALRSPLHEDFVDASGRQFCASARECFQACADFDANRQFLLGHVERVIYVSKTVCVDRPRLRCRRSSCSAGGSAAPPGSHAQHLTHLVAIPRLAVRALLLGRAALAAHLRLDLRLNAVRVRELLDRLQVDALNEHLLLAVVDQLPRRLGCQLVVDVVVDHRSAPASDADCWRSQACRPDKIFFKKKKYYPTPVGVAPARYGLPRAPAPAASPRPGPSTAARGAG